MITKNNIKQLLIEYSKTNKDIHLEKTLQFLEENDNLFGKDNLSGHITGSAWILDETKTKVLLIHHKKLELWLQPGGHYDLKDSSIIETARRETIEETGLKSVVLLSKKLFDLDVHLIPARKRIPAHYHYDFRFLFQANNDVLNPDFNEVNDIKWVGLKDIIDNKNFETLNQMANKIRSYQFS